MLVDVVRMRQRGLKLSVAQIRSIRPVRGVLGMTAVRPGWYSGKRNAPMLATLAHPSLIEQVLPALDQARVTQIGRGALLIVGIEEIEWPVRAIHEYPQAWLVRPVTDAPPRFECNECGAPQAELGRCTCTSSSQPVPPSAD